MLTIHTNYHSTQSEFPARNLFVPRPSLLHPRPGMAVPPSTA
ncbi:MAG TPA: hypothetical protein VF600_09875 [Abditibacteriaceae bacterium]